MAKVPGGQPGPTESTVKRYKVASATNTPVQIGSAASKKIRSVRVASNQNSSAAWLKFYNTAAAPTPGSDKPAMVVRVPAGATGEVACVPYGDGTDPVFSNGLWVGAANAAGLTADDPSSTISLVLEAE
jgi:hypothetical protein